MSTSVNAFQQADFFHAHSNYSSYGIRCREEEGWMNSGAFISNYNGGGVTDSDIAANGFGEITSDDFRQMMLTKLFVVCMKPIFQ